MAQYTIEVILMIYGISLSSIKEQILAFLYRDSNEYIPSINSMSIAYSKQRIATICIVFFIFLLLLLDNALNSKNESYFCCSLKKLQKY